jgi:hypothetical protein
MTERTERASIFRNQKLPDAQAMLDAAALDEVILAFLSS